MVVENISQEFRLKNIDETRNYFIKEIDQNELMNKRHKKVCTTLNYIENFFILAPVAVRIANSATGWFAFFFLVPFRWCWCCPSWLCWKFSQCLFCCFCLASLTWGLISAWWWRAIFWYKLWSYIQERYSRKIKRLIQKRELYNF